jgi:hypothetical protein
MQKSHEIIIQELTEAGLPAGVEADNENRPSEPFDPASISIETKVVSMDAILRRLKQGTIRLAPSFQRKFVWDEARKSRLIESLMLRIPLPMFYVAANEDGSWDVVDGLQRLTTIRDFILGNEKSDLGKRLFPDAKTIRLTELEFWGERFNTKSFSDIEKIPNNAIIVNNIMETELRFTVINPGTPEEVKRNIFKRINTGGMPLTTQEIRHALYQGESTILLEKLVNLRSFNNATDKSIDDSRMAARELVLRFLSFYISGWEKYRGDMDTYLSNTMRILNGKYRSPSNLSNDLTTPTINEIEKSFEVAMLRCRRFFGIYAFRKAVLGMRRTPVNKALFETWGILLGRLSESEFKKLANNKVQFNLSYKKILLSDEFDRAISRDSSSYLSTKYRYLTLDRLMNNFLD